MELRDLIVNGYPLNLDSYPIFDEQYRAVLNDKIIRHFYFREIGLETPEKFAFFLNRKMNEIMPYYNQVYESELISYDPLFTDYFEHSRDDSRLATQEQYGNSTSISQGTTGDVFTYNRDTTSSEKTSGLMDGKTTGTSSSHETTTGKSHDEGTSQSTESVAKEGTNTGHRTLDETGNTKGTTSGTSKTTGSTSSDTTASSDTTTKTDEKSSKGTVFSDLPQAKVTVTGGSGTGGAGIGIDGYATTYTGENATGTTNSTQSMNSDSSTTGDSTSDATSSGTSNTDTTRHVTEDTTGSWTETDKITRSGSTTGDGTTSGSRDATGNTSGTSHETTSGTADSTGNAKEDSQRNVEENRRQDNGSVTVGETAEKAAIRAIDKGRRGVSPAELIQRYRDSLINIDMMVVEELEPLFMQIY